MQIEWTIIHLLCIIVGALVSGQEEQLKVFDWQAQHVHIAFGGELISYILLIKLRTFISHINLCTNFAKLI